jgi:hypothetical protein
VEPADLRAAGHQATRDGVTWNPVVDDVAERQQELRPGMPTVARMGEDRWILVYEMCSTLVGDRPVTYRIAHDPERFATARAHTLLLADADPPAGHPYVVWSPLGGANGSIVVSYGSGTDLAVNHAGGDPYAWSSLPSHVGSGYSRSLLLAPDGS